MADSLNTLTLKQALDGIRDKAFSAKEIVGAVADEIQLRNGDLNVFLARADKKSTTDQSSALSGVPIAVKDNFLTVGMPTTASSNVLDGFDPPFESTVTRRIKDAGGVVIGKTNMDAWAHGSSTETSDFGPTKNPRNTAYLPGGSSGGSAAAVAADMCTVAIGSETAGSIRQPASWCGVVGLKPTYGRVSRYGVVAMGSSLDCPGPMGKTVEDCALMLNVIAGHDVYDATTPKREVPDYTDALNRGVKGKKVGIAYVDHADLEQTDASSATAAAGAVFESLGAHVETIALSQQLKDNAILTPDHAIGVYTVVQRGEVSSNLARYDGIRYGNGRDAFGDEAKRRIMLGTFTLSKGYSDKYYVRAQQIRSLYIQNFEQLFSTYDLIIAPTSPGYALKLGALGDNPMFGELQDFLVEPSSLAGLPGISVPCGYDEGTNLYLGLNIMGKQWDEEGVIAAAAAYERATDWNSWRSRP